MIEVDDQLCLAPIKLDQLKSSRNQAGRRLQSGAIARRGRQLHSLPWRRVPAPVLDLPASLRARLLRGGSLPEVDDLRSKQFLQRQKALIIFVLDASESMAEGALERIKAAKGAVLALLTSAYQNRDQVALVCFRGEQAEVLLRPTFSVSLARQQLRKLPVGGATPFADGLWQAWQLVRGERQKQRGLKAQLVILSDGAANRPLAAQAEVFPELFALARQIRRDHLDSLVIDSGGALGHSRLRQLAGELGGSYQLIRQLHAGRLLDALRAAQPSAGP